MRDRDLSFLLIPVLAVLSIAFPVLGRSTRAVPRTEALAPARADGDVNASAETPPQAAGVGALLEAYGDTKKAAHCVIATVPDPVDAANLAYTFDRYVDAMQRAMEAASYTLDRFDLPWRDPGAAKAAALPAGGSRESGPRFHSEPGVLLFRGRGPQAGGTYALIFLVGETPTAGVHKRVLGAALDQYRDRCSDKPVRVLGPSFSGSVTSLRTGLGSQEASVTTPLAPDTFRIISGSATAVDPKLLDEGFKTTVLPDTPALEALALELERLNGGVRPRIGLLTEANTAYGAAAGEQHAFLSLPFPLHIAKLRQASQRRPDAETADAAHVRHRLTSLDLRSPIDSHTVVPLLSTIETSSMEVVLATLLETIARENLRYIGVFASDVHDRIFLVQEVRHHSPNTVVFALASDLLYLHPDVNLDFRGMLVVSPYPLFGPNQVWTGGSTGGERRLLFPTQTAQGVYNALLALVDRADLMLEYGRPLDPTSPIRPWLSIVGSNGIWPVRLLDASPALNASLDASLYTRPNAPDGGGDRPRISPLVLAIERESHPWLLAIVAAICLLPAITVLAQYRRSSLEAVEDWTANTRLALIFGDQVYGHHRFERRLYLLASLTAFVFVLLVTTTLSALVPLYAGVFNPSRGADWWRAALWAFAFTGILLTIGAAATVWHTLFSALRRARRWVNRRGRRSRARRRLGARTSAFSAMSATLAVVLVLTLTLCAGWLSTGVPSNLMLALRSVDLDSGVSPLLPLLFLGGAAIVWSTGALRRLRLVDGIDRRGYSFLGLNAGSFEGVGRLERDVLIAVGRPSLQLSVPAVAAVTLVLATVWVRLFLIRTSPTVEGSAYDWLVRAAFFFVYFALLLSFLRFVFLWRKLHRLLLRLSWHPTITAYDRLSRQIPGKPKVGLAAATQVYTALEFSVHRASRLVALADRMAQPAPAPATAAAGPAITVDLLLTRLLGLGSPPPPAEPSNTTATAHALTRQVTAIRSILSEHVGRAERALKDALSADARHDWRTAIRKRCLAEAHLAKVSELVASRLERAWRLPADLRPEPATTGRGDQQTDEELWFEYGEDFIASRVASFVSHIVPQLQNLIVFLTAGLLLMLLGLTSYPFQPQQLLLAFNWTLVVGVAGTALAVFVQMERDTVLSVLSDTKPGQISWSRDFVGRVLMYVVLPIGSVLGAQFPEVTSAIVSWTGAIFGGHS